MVCLNHTDQPVCAVHDRKSMQVVLVEEFRDIILVGLCMRGNNARLGQNRNSESQPSASIRRPSGTTPSSTSFFPVR